MDRIDRVSIVGMGAMGILYGDFFANALGREGQAVQEYPGILQWKEDGFPDTGRSRA